MAVKSEKPLELIATITDDLPVAIWVARAPTGEFVYANDLFGEPLHPYTQGLLRSLPRLGYSGNRLETVAGVVPEPLNFPSGCKFHPRCPVGCDDKRCQEVEPILKEVRSGRKVACWYAPGYE